MPLKLSSASSDNLQTDPAFTALGMQPDPALTALGTFFVTFDAVLLAVNAATVATPDPPDMFGTALAVFDELVEVMRVSCKISSGNGVIADAALVSTSWAVPGVPAAAARRDRLVRKRFHGASSLNASDAVAGCTHCAAGTVTSTGAC